MKAKSLHASRRNHVYQRKALALALGSIVMGFTGAAWAQAITSTIHGTVPVAPNEIIQITGGAGFSRTVTVGPSGKYSVILPVGSYDVALLQDGKVVRSRRASAPQRAVRRWSISPAWPVPPRPMPPMR